MYAGMVVTDPNHIFSWLLSPSPKQAGTRFLDPIVCSRLQYTGEINLHHVVSK